MEFTGEELIRAIQTSDTHCEIGGVQVDGEFATKLTLHQNNAEFLVIVDGKECFLPEQVHHSFIIAQIKTQEDQEMDWDLVGYLEKKITDTLQENKPIVVTHKPDSGIRKIRHDGRDFFFGQALGWDSLIITPDGTVHQPCFYEGDDGETIFKPIGKAIHAIAT